MQLSYLFTPVTDLEAAAAFYRDVLGLEVVLEQERRGGYLARITGYPDAHVRMAQLEAAGGGHRIELFEYVSPEDVRADVEPRNVGAPHVCFLVEVEPDLLRWKLEKMRETFQQL